MSMVIVVDLVMTVALIADNLLADKKILDDLARSFNPDNDRDLELVKQLLTNGNFTCKEELVAFLLLESKKRGYSILKRLLWVQ
jgi:hypothetical protein